MSATDVHFGITLVTGALVKSVETDFSVQVKELVGSTGEVARVRPYKSMTEGSVKGSGNVTITPGVGSAGVSSVTGGVTVITNLKQGEDCEDYNTWEYSFKNYPSAQSVA